MNKYFVVSDIHSFYTPLMDSLHSVGFDIKNNEHILIVCGDVFDRGSETIKVYDFLTSIPKDRLKLIKGNHEYLYQALLKKGLPDSYDYSNGTVKTFCHIANIDLDKMTPSYWYAKCEPHLNVREQLSIMWELVKEKVRDSEITKWINDDNLWLDYYELNDFIFVHSFIPTKVKDEYQSLLLCGFPLNPSCYEYNSEWRKFPLHCTIWENATWGCPWEQFNNNLFSGEQEQGKRLVVGHWHTSDFHKVYENKNDRDYSIYYGKNLIALDGCTALTQNVNVLVIDNDTCYDQNNNELKY